MTTLNKKPTLHFFIQLKGGVGKTTLAFFFAQYLSEKYAKKPELYELGSNQPSFSKFKEFDVTSIRMRDADGSFNSPMSSIIAQLFVNTIKSNTDAVIEVCSPIYDQFVEYFASSHKLPMNDCDIIFHVIMTGGGDTDICQQCLDQLIKVSPPMIKFYLWLNEFHGDNKRSKFIGIRNSSSNYFVDGRNFDGLISINNYRNGPHSDAWIQMLSGQKSFLLASNDMPRPFIHSVSVIKNEIYSSINKVL